MIIRTSKEFKARYHDLGPGDMFIGTLAYKYLKPSVLIDLLERGVTCLPSPLAQNLHSSKTAQALVLKDWMLPHTIAITRRMDLIETINQYNKLGIGAVVTKEDHLHCGHGIRRWENIEALYSMMALSESSYPFVVQPFLEDFTDVRVIIVGDFVEAYVRHNPDNFRMNISFGGKPRPYHLNDDQKQFCLTVMERGKFPYAHMDLQVLENNQCYLSEIALNGGIKGASISRKELEQKKQDLLENLANPDIS
jgi:glutathione synthase/RimK-type ligase-like ATP-grasp enzyme